MIALALGAVLPPGARADVVTRPPRNCPYGTFGVSGRHVSGTYCAFQVCETDADCGERRRVCRPAAVCTEERTSRYFLDRMRTRTRSVTEHVGHAECTEQLCAQGTCTRARFCVPSGEARPEEPADDVAVEAEQLEVAAPSAPVEEVPALSRRDPETPAAPPSSGLCSASRGRGSLAPALALAALAARRRRRR